MIGIVFHSIGGQTTGNGLLTLKPLTTLPGFDTLDYCCCKSN